MQLERKELMTRLSDYLRRGLTNQQIYDLIDTLWRDPYSPRTSGFELAGGTDTEMSAESGDLMGDDGFHNYIVFSIRPMRKKFKFYHYRKILALEKRQQEDTIHILSGEGKFLIFYEKDQETKRFSLQHVRNPQRDERLDIITYSVMVASIYFDAEKEEIIYFGDNRHGSLWNPWMHWAWHETINSMRESGLHFIDIVPDQDGSEDRHAQFGISPGSCFHEDIHATSEGKDAPASLPVWYFKQGSLPRIYEGSVNSLVINGTLCYNNNAITPADKDKFVFYHIFFTNDTLEPMISVMGQAQYDTVGEASELLPNELETVRNLLPHENILHIGSLLFQTSAEYKNSLRSRIITQTSRVITRWSVEGDGSAATPVQLLNDEEDPEAGKFYGADPISGAKGWHNLDSRLFRSGQIIYLQSEDSDISGYKQATTVEPDGAAVSYWKEIIPLSGEQSIKKFVTPAGFPGTKIIPAGPWNFTIWAAVNTNDLCVMVVRVSKIDESDEETELFDFELNITEIAITQHLKTVAQNQIELNNERLVVEYLFQNYGSTENRMYLAVEGNETAEYWWSNIQLPLPSGAPQVQADWEEEDTDSPAYIKNKPSLATTEPQHFDWPDIESGESQTYPICPYVDGDGTLLYVALEADATMDDITIEINGSPVEFTGSAYSVDVTTSMTKFEIVGDNTITEGDRVTLVTSGTDGGATRLTGTLVIQKS